YVLERLQANNWLYGGEGSGHLLCLDKHTTGDGIVAALQVLTAMKHQGKSVAELVSDLSMYPQIMVNVPWEKGADWRQPDALVSASKAVEQALGNRGRVLIRASGTEPILRLMVEAQEARLAEQSIDTLRAAFN